MFLCVGTSNRKHFSTLNCYYCRIYKSYVSYKLSACVWTILHCPDRQNMVSEREMLYSKHHSGIHAKVICDCEIRSREHIGTKTTFLFYFQHQVLRDCRVDFSELSKKAPVRCYPRVYWCEIMDAYFMPMWVWSTYSFLETLCQGWVTLL